MDIDSNVYYGLAPREDVTNEWNYIVFGQSKLKKSGTSSTDLNGYYYVTIIREDYIPDELIFDVIDKMSEINGLRLADGDYQFTYLTKGNTNMVVEVLQLDFTKTKKRFS